MVKGAGEVDGRWKSQDFRQKIKDKRYKTEHRRIVIQDGKKYNAEAI